MELSSSNIKNSFKRKLSLYFGKWNFFSPSSKIFLYFRKWKPRKNFLYFLKKNCSYISGNGKPEKKYFRKQKPQKNFLYFTK